MPDPSDLSFQPPTLGPRRGVMIDVTSNRIPEGLPAAEQAHFETYDLVYRTLCGILYNFVPSSGHPGGSISSGRIVAGLLFEQMAYDIGNPEHPSADLLVYAAGHKAMGLYAMWALRDECARIASPDLLATDEINRLRLEDLLGFRRNPTQNTPLFRRLRAKPLDGHPTPQTPFVKIATGASGVGVPAAFGLGFGALDTWGKHAPTVHVLEGEGGLTPGRVAEALSTASTARLWNLRLHIDWNQASIDSDAVCGEGTQAGDYVPWNPLELCALHDWNVIYVPDGKDVAQVAAAQRVAARPLNNQPTAVVYRTIKGWRYGIEGRKSHGAGHPYLSEAYYRYLEPFEERFGVSLPHHQADPDPVAVEAAFHETLMTIRQALEADRAMCDFMAERLASSRERLASLERRPRPATPNLEAFYRGAVSPQEPPPSCRYPAESKQTLRGALGDALGYLNELTGGGFIGAAADLLDSTSISKLAGPFPTGFYDALDNPDARLVATGGICEDSMGAFMSGISSYGHHIGAGSSYAAFIAALQHVAARLHGIGQQAGRQRTGLPYNPFIIVCAHAGLKTGEDGPTHADPQALQLLQENFPPGVMITLTPWDPQEVFPLLVTALQRRPAVIAPFVTRPTEVIADRAALGLPGPEAAMEGLYALRRADPDTRPYHGTVVLQGSGETNVFVHEVLPQIDRAGLNLNIYYAASLELFDLLPKARQEAIFPTARAEEAMGITGFTPATLYRWITSAWGRAHSRHAFSVGHYLGSGQAHKVLEEAGLHAQGQWEAVLTYAEAMEKRAGT